MFNHRIVQEHWDPYDGSGKFVVQFDPLTAVECVYLPGLPAPPYYGICISTQSGCRMGCTFCATALKLDGRNLKAEEMVAQVRLVHEEVSASCPGLKLNFVTFSGMGEPLANLNECLLAVELLQEFRLDMISISTVGIVSKLQTLISNAPDIRLYLSLHGANELTRKKIIPITRHNSISDLVALLDKFGKRHGARNAIISYLLLPGINDGEKDLEELTALTSNLSITIQILRWNSVPRAGFSRVSDKVVAYWLEHLNHFEVTAYEMKSMGQRIDAGCGQLLTAATSR